MDRVRLAELCASTSLFTDLGTGHPAEHGLRTCLVAMRLAQTLELTDDDRRCLFYVTLLRFLGCTADAHVVAEMAGGDEIGLFAAMAPVTMGSPREELTQMLRLVGAGSPMPQRLRSLARVMTDPRGKDPLLQAHCEVAGRLATEMGLPGAVVSSLEVAYARWDGTGVPDGVGGETIPVSVRVGIVARDIEVWAREAGDEAAAEILRRRSGRSYDPRVVEAALLFGVEDLRRFEGDPWDLVLDAEPAPHAVVVGPDLDRALIALGDFSDLKIPQRAGHSRRVAAVVGRAQVRSDDVVAVSRAAMVHDLGLVGVPVGVLLSRSPGPAGEEQLRMHPLWTQRLLGRCRSLSAVGTLAGRHHERLDGSGYPAGTSGEEPAGFGLLACAVLYEELTSGVGRPAMTSDEAAREMTRLASEGGLALADVKAILDANHVIAPIVEMRRPAGLTEREVDILLLLARGATNREIGEKLGISKKTVGSHVEHIYAKAGVTTRAAATLFAAQNGLV